MRRSSVVMLGRWDGAVRGGVHGGALLLRFWLVWCVALGWLRRCSPLHLFIRFDKRFGQCGCAIIHWRWRRRRRSPRLEFCGARVGMLLELADGKWQAAYRAGKAFAEGVCHRDYAKRVDCAREEGAATTPPSFETTFASTPCTCSSLNRGATSQCRPQQRAIAAACLVLCRRSLAACCSPRHSRPSSLVGRDPRAPSALSGRFVCPPPRRTARAPPAPQSYGALLSFVGSSGTQRRGMRR